MNSILYYLDKVVNLAVALNGTTYLEVLSELLDIIDQPTVDKSKLSQMIFTVRRVLSEDIAFINDLYEDKTRSITLEKRTETQIRNVGDY